MTIRDLLEAGVPDDVELYASRDGAFAYELVLEEYAPGDAQAILTTTPFFVTLPLKDVDE
jgi:hypothetical protein